MKHRLSDSRNVVRLFFGDLHKQIFNENETKASNLSYITLENYKPTENIFNYWKLKFKSL